MEPAETQARPFDFEAFFHAHYGRIARVVVRVLGDRGRAEDLASEALWKLWRTPQAQGESAAGWLYRTAVRLALNELRSGKRRSHYEALSDGPQAVPTRNRHTPPRRSAPRSARCWRRWPRGKRNC